MGEDLAAFILASSAVTTIIADRLTWNRRPQGSALPALVLTVISSVPDYTMDGASGLERTRVQADCWAKTKASADALAAALRARLSGFSGNLDAVHLSAFWEDETDSFERTSADEELHRKRIDLMIWHRELVS